jgi:hypothetical protein
MHRRLTALFFLLTCAGLPLFGQLDTLFFEDFVDNRNGWKEYRGESGSQEIKEGCLHVTELNPVGIYSYPSIKKDLTGQDSFVYELRIIPEIFNYGGAVYNVNHRKSKGEKPPKLCCYSAMVVQRRGLYCYEYHHGDGWHNNNWNLRLPELKRDTMTFRLAYGSGQLRCFYNGEKMGSYRFKPTKQHPVWDRWGWLSRGYAKFKVDYLVLLGKKQGGG